MGTHELAAEAIREWLEAGADTIDLVLPQGVPEEQLRDMLEAAATSGGARAEVARLGTSLSA
jgi:alkanesulfonate monooxygenase SsuD/methylene tetrahydromethanopterin reductase-like flavin-dependent oxidoreductase (luciferase family)